jgi:hypothetical protein
MSMKADFVSILVRAGADATLANFPLRDGQYFDGEDQDEYDNTICELRLGKYGELTAAQEQALNTNDDVLSWSLQDDD